MDFAGMWAGRFGGEGKTGHIEGRVGRRCLARQGKGRCGSAGRRCLPRRGKGALGVRAPVWVTACWLVTGALCGQGYLPSARGNGGRGVLFLQSPRNLPCGGATADSARTRLRAKGP